VVNEGTPKPDCTARVNFDRNADLPGYSVERNGRRACLPFMPTNQLVPPDYKGRDFYGEAFTDQAIKARWTECKKDSACAERVIAGAKPFISAEKRDTGVSDAVGKVDPEAEVDLKAIRRPAFFGKAAYDEAIAAAEPRTFTVEFTVPRDNYERLHLKKDGSLKLRGWYLQGAGVDDGAGRRVRALVVMNNGGGSEITAIDDPRSEGAGRIPRSSERPRAGRGRRRLCSREPRPRPRRGAARWPRRSRPGEFDPFPSDEKRFFQSLRDHHHCRGPVEDRRKRGPSHQLGR
jgi:hypothetical protein